MDSGCALIFVLLISSHQAFCYSGDPVMYLPPFEVRTMKDGRRPPFVPNQQFPVSRGSGPPMQPQSIMHTSPAPYSQSEMRMEREKSDDKNFTFNELVDVFNNHEGSRDERYEVPNKIERPDLPRSAYDYPAPPYGYRPPPYGYQGQNYGPLAYHESGSAPPAGHHSASKISLLKPDLGDLLKPTTAKVAGKVSGLIGLVLALLTGSAPNDLELKGFKDIIINGIVKPLLLAKGGIKSLVSKLTIPVISILLINLEVLITIWWLWEDCPENKPPPYEYPRPSYGYNTYR